MTKGNYFKCNPKMNEDNLLRVHSTRDSMDEFLNKNEKNPNNSIVMSKLLETIKSMREVDPLPATVGLFKIQSEEVSSVKVTNNLSKVAAGTEDSEIVLWNLDLADDLQYFSSRFYKHWKHRPGRTNDAGVDFKYINYSLSTEQASEMTDNNVEPVILRGHSKPIYDLYFMPNSDLLFSASGDTSLRAWNTKNTSCMAVYHGHLHAVWTIDSGEAGYFVSGDRNGQVLLWNVQRNAPLRTVAAHEMDINQVRFHRNQKYIATASSDKTISLWQMNEARCVRHFTGHTAAVNTVCFSPCGQYLASGSADGSIRVWNIDQGTMLCELVDHKDNIRNVVFSPSGNSIASCGARVPTLYYWLHPMSKQELCKKNTYELGCIAMDKQGHSNTSLIDLVYINKSTDMILAIGKQCR